MTWTLSDSANLALTCLHQHRLLTTSQLHQLLHPGRTLRTTQRLLADLAGQELISSVRRQGGRRGTEAVWHLSPTGAEVVHRAPDGAEPRHKPITAQIAAGPLQRHTLAVNDACLAFVTAARARGDECGPLAWRHEIAHPISARRSDAVIADAVLRYQSASSDGAVVLDYRFIELDRATMPVDQLATKLARYTQLATYTPPGARRSAWRTRYLALPDLLGVLADASSARLQRRIEHLVSLSRGIPGLGRDPALGVWLCRLDQLTEHGPYAPIFTRLDQPGQPCDWLGHPGAS
jgi:hypothetical protein